MSGDNSTPKRTRDAEAPVARKRTTDECQFVKVHRAVMPGLFDELWKLREQAVCASGVMFGRRWISTTRRTLQYGTSAYTFNGSPAASVTTAFPPVVQQVKDKTCELVDYAYNFALVTFYDTDGQLGWHADDEQQIDQRYPIVSWSFGTKARFAIKDNGPPLELFDYDLEDGDVLIMMPGCQEKMKHCLRKVAGPRVNITLQMLK
jgi:alkylated DNA repair dioxygenase AlkB